MFDHLKAICKKEKINIDDEALKIVVKRGGGSYRDSLSLLDQVSTLSDDKITAELLNRAMGLPQEAAIEELLSAYASNNTDSIRKTLTQLVETGIKSEVIASELIDAIMANPSANYIQLLDKLTQIGPSDAPNIKAGKLLVALCANAPVYPVQPMPAPIAQKATAPLPKPKADPAPTPKAPEPQPVAETPVEKPKVERVANDAGADEIWQAVVKNVAANSPLITGDLFASKYTLKDNVLTIYTGSHLRFRNLDKRRSFITEVLPDSISLEITKETLADDPDVANIAAIMGGGEEIQIDA